MRKISPRCDELVAVGWRTFAAKGEVGESVRGLPKFAAGVLRNQCAVWCNFGQSEEGEVEMLDTLKVVFVAKRKQWRFPIF